MKVFSFCFYNKRNTLHTSLGICDKNYSCFAMFLVPLNKNKVLGKERSLVLMAPVHVPSYLQRTQLITITPFTAICLLYYK